MTEAPLLLSEDNEQLLRIDDSNLPSVTDGGNSAESQEHSVKKKIVHIGSLDCEVEDITDIAVYKGEDLVRYHQYNQTSEEARMYCEEHAMEIEGVVPFDSHLTAWQILTKNNYVLDGIPGGKVSIYKAGICDDDDTKKLPSLTPLVWLRMAILFVLVIMGTYLAVESSLSHNESYKSDTAIVERHNAGVPVDSDAYSEARNNVDNARNDMYTYCGAAAIAFFFLIMAFVDLIYSYLPDTIRRFYVPLMFPGNSNKDASEDDPAWGTVPITSEPLDDTSIAVLEKCEALGLPIKTAVPKGGIDGKINRLTWEFRPQWGWKRGKGLCFIWKKEKIDSVRVTTAPSFIFPFKEEIVMLKTRPRTAIEQ